MKASEVKKCAGCGKGVAHAGTPIFYRMKLETMGLDAKAIERRAGLEMIFGGGRPGAALAQVMGPDEPIAKVVTTTEVLICQPCALEPRPLLLLVEDERGGEPASEDAP